MKTALPANGELAYLATPFSLYEHGHKTAFVEASRLSARLLIEGVKVYSPIVQTWSIALWGCLDPLDHGLWISYDEAMMQRADVLIVAEMAGWQDSKGVAHEIAFFERAGKPIFYLDPVTLEMRKRAREAA